MVMKVRITRPINSKTLVDAIMNSDSPYHLQSDVSMARGATRADVLDGNQIEEVANNKSYRDPNGSIDVSVPVCHDRCDRGVLCADQHGSSEEVCPTHCKSQGRVDISASKFEDGPS
jgi:hypothetical protein